MAKFEIINEQNFGPSGSFAPKADQREFVSTFAVVSGEKKAGWQDAHTVQQGIPTQDGRAKLSFEEFKGKDGKANDITVNGMKLREFVAPRDQSIEKEKYDANLSNEKMRAASRPVTIAPSATTVGLTKGMELDQLVPAGPSALA